MKKSTRQIFFTVSCILFPVASTFAGWTKAVVDSGPFGYLQLGKGRNDDTVRLYGIGNNLLQEITFRNGSWFRDTIGVGGSGSVLSPVHNDSINRIYTLKADTLYEYTWNNRIWEKINHPLPFSSSGFFASPLRNDDTVRLYFTQNSRSYFYELSFRIGMWELDTTDSFPAFNPGNYVTANGRNDDTLRLYIPRLWDIWYYSGFDEITFSNGKWREEPHELETVAISPFVSPFLIIGIGRNDAQNRLYIGYQDHAPGLSQTRWSYVAIGECSYSQMAWVRTDCCYYENDGWPVPIPRLIDKVRDDTTRLYAYLHSETTGLYEFTYYPTSWKKQLVDSSDIDFLNVGQGRNDNTNRLYGIQNNKIFELTWSPTGVDEQTGNLKPFQPALQITPNPFSDRVEIRYQVALTDRATVRIFDATGRLVKDFAGVQSREPKVRWNGDDETGKKLPNGVYFCQLRTAGQTISKKVTLLR